ncbi:MAG: DUF3131 domain-containing protein [Clostridia bacterium]|nr:DUF3131 domain-containing protein [Clostridia bacterium]
MLWIVPVIILAALLFFLLKRQRGGPVLPTRNAPLEDALPAYMETLAARPVSRKQVRLLPRAGQQKQMEQPLRYLSSLQEEDLLPASRWFSGHGRMLQEETAALLQALKHSCPLPATEEGEPRIACFARAFLAHTNADITPDRLQQAMEAWQKQCPFTVRELDQLPQALRNALLRLLTELAQQCESDQRTAAAANSTLQALKAREDRQAIRLFEHNRHSSLYLIRLNSLIREAGDGDSVLWRSILPVSDDLTGDELLDEDRIHQSEAVRWVSNSIASLQRMDRLPWKELLEAWSYPHQLLQWDETYCAMDAASRSGYRCRAGEIGRLGRRSEKAVCEAIRGLCSGFEPGDVRAHCGYYLLDNGLPELLQALQIPCTLPVRIRFGQRLEPLWRSLLSCTFIILTGLLALTGANILLSIPCALLLTHALSQWLKIPLGRYSLPRMVPRIQLSTLPDEARTLVVCPTMLLSASHALRAVRQLSILQKANPDPNLHFLLLGDFRDSMAGSLADDEEIIQTAASAIQALREDTGHPFFYLQRERVYHLPDHVHMSRERKRGGLETVMKLMEGQPVEDSFAYASIQPEKLHKRYRYLITLDSDTFMPPGAALQMAGAMLHPLQRRHATSEGIRGVSVIQPAMRTALHMAKTPLARLMDQIGGADSYNALHPDFEQDILGCGSFQGKGIIDPKAFLTATRDGVVSGAVLSHDLLEGLLGGCARAADITLFEGQPDTLQSQLTRLHRWTRGDWQLLPYWLDFLPERTRPKSNMLLRGERRRIRNTLGLSLIRPLQLITVVLCVVFHQPWLLLLALLCVDSPVLAGGVGSIIPYFLRIAMLPPDALTRLDAIGRALYRLLFSRQYLLQWTTAAESELKPAKQDLRSFYMSMGAAGTLALLCILPGALRFPGIALAALWASFPLWLPVFEKPAQTVFHPTGYMKEVLLRLARNTLLFFETAITQEDHGLPPDNVQIDPNKGIAHRTSPTNIGLYLCALVSAQRLELITADELAQRIRPTVEAMEKLEKWHGHLMNWYDTRTLEPLRPRFISSVDSGNLAVCLLTTAQGLRCLLEQLPEYDHDLPLRLDALAEQMQFAPLYDHEADLFFNGYDMEAERLTQAHYDLLASESRMGSFYAIMTGQVPLRHWYRLGRTRVWTRRGQSLLSASGTMFEYLMPFLLQPPMDGTLLAETARSAIRMQQAHKLGGLSGVSESGYYAFDPNLVYQYKAFGLSQLALNPKTESSVIAPYATLLCLPLMPRAAFANLLHMQSLGLEGPLGLFEAADFDPARIGKGRPMQIIHSHMAHHQGMILCAICNFLCEGALAGLFFHLPAAQAYRLLLEEPMLRLPGVLRHPLQPVPKDDRRPSMLAANPVPSLTFPIKAHVLHGAGTTLLVDAQGGGYLSKNGTMMTRFHESCHIPSGLRLYLRDSQTGHYWQVTAPSADVVFETAQACFTLLHSEIQSNLRIFVDPLSGAAVHALTLENQSPARQMMEVCSYLEPSLYPQKDMEAHPAYRKLFLETGRLGSYGASIRRRPTSPDEDELQLWHHLATDVALSVFHIQTDRCAFLGRGRTMQAPRELEKPLSSLADTLGAVIDPCISLRGQFVLEPEQQARFIFVTHMPKPGESSGAFLLRCDTPDSVLGWYDAALTQALVTARSLALPPEEQALLAPVCGLIAYTGQPSQSRRADGNTLPIRALHALKITGDLPVVTMECNGASAPRQLAVMLRLHALCRMSGLWFDLAVTVSGDAPDTLPARIQETVQRSHSGDLLDQNGGVHLLLQLSTEQRQLLAAASRLMIRTADGPLEDQLAEMNMPAQTRPLYRQKAGQRWKLALPATPELLCANGTGGFTRESGDYVITLPPGQHTPAPWCNPLCNEVFGTLAAESGLIFSYAGHCGTGRLNRWSNDSITPAGEENFFLRDHTNRLLWSLTRQPLGEGLAVRITHAPGETVYESSGYGIYSRMHCFTCRDLPLGLRVIHLRNEDSAERILTFWHTLILTVDDDPASAQLCRVSKLSGGLCMENPQKEGVLGICAIEPEAAIMTSMSAGVFQGLWGTAPAALSGAELPTAGGGNTALLGLTIQLKPGESKTITCAVAHGQRRGEVVRLLQRVRQEGATALLHQTKQVWEHRLSGLRFDLPDEGLCLLLNRWLPYQVRAARLMMRGAFYQAGGGIGFRDQLQDMLSLLLTEPERVRAHLLLCAAHQFEEGDVQHWWHPERFGVRTRISDDRLFLPYVTAAYVETTGDRSILDEQIPWLTGDALGEEENQRLFDADVTERTDSLLEHCLRAIRLTETGFHGLPLMGSGDWNDGLTCVGGESVWLGMFLCEVLRRFAPLCKAETARLMEEKRAQLLHALDSHGWDGGWYLRGWYADGQPLGSNAAEECRIDVLPQSWAVFSGVSRDRCVTAMENVWRMLYQRDAGLLRLFTPPFDGQQQPGSIAGYLPGIRENGGQYTHAVPWAVAALHQLGQHDRAWTLATAILPTRHTATPQLTRRYRAEPYVLAGDIYTNPQQRGRGGWTWYTGSAGWYLTVVTEQLLGLRKTGNRLRFRPVLPSGWDEAHLSYRYGAATYHLHATRECTVAVADGQELPDGTLLLTDDGRVHEATFPAR